MFCQSIFNISSIKFQPFIYIKKHLLFANHMSIKSNNNINFVKTKSTKHRHLFNMKWMLIFYWCPTLNFYCKNLYFINLSLVFHQLNINPSLTSKNIYFLSIIYLSKVTRTSTLSSQNQQNINICSIWNGCWSFIDAQL